MSELKFNINGYVKVKLNDSGITELKRQHKKLSESFPKLGEFKSPKVDDDGYSKFQMHDLMLRLGHLCQLGFEPPFDANIIICTDSP